ncbi:hypothetical protein BX661DRAFT_99339 [Kickxella alabastrina]|uniref:uncharacterized protein n=1 Tax=Kickxella alabastrina TaxID=61397 RepID=UPI002220E6FA|nr:uncharacterized protein BX661DRAFT_99339 [Kickxella alabastrina]KAI7829062.1 hypothetical protein BX661DRAFT_99339 [Kickxella alabastrina]
MIEDYAKRIEALMLEGQEWSSKELRLSNTVKKLRVDSKGYEKTAHLVQRKLDVSVAKNDELNEKLRQATQSDRAIAARVRSEMDKPTTEGEGACRSDFSTQNGIGKYAGAATSTGQGAAAADDGVEEEARDREVSSLTKIRSLQARVCSADIQNSDVAAVIQEHTRPLLMQIEEVLMRQTEQRREWSRKEEQLAIEARDATKEALNLEQQLLTAPLHLKPSAAKQR